jgi:hypothetical protein
MANESNAEFNAEEQAMLAELAKGEQSPAPEAPATAEASIVAAEPAGQAAATDEAKPVEGAQAAPESAAAAPQGDTRAALRAARRDAKRAHERTQQLEQEIADLKAGKTLTVTQVTDEELAELDENFPVAAKLARQVQELNTKLQQAPKEVPKDDFEPVRYDPEIQEVIDSVPELVNWQYDPKTQDRFHAAIEMDKYLMTLPDWQNKPLNERLAEVTRRVKADVAPGEPKRDPQAVIDALKTDGPKRISDFKGGMQPDKSTPDYSRMTDEEIIASLPA